MVGILVAVDQSLIKIKEYGLKIGIFSRELDVLTRVCYLDALPEPQYLNLLIKMLSEEVHEITGLVLPQATV